MSQVTGMEIATAILVIGAIAMAGLVVALRARMTSKRKEQ